jgi:hypothetical protein
LADSNGNSTHEINSRLRDVVEKAQKTPSDENLMELLQVVFGLKAF